MQCTIKQCSVGCNTCSKHACLSLAGCFAVWGSVLLPQCWQVGLLESMVAASIECGECYRNAQSGRPELKIELNRWRLVCCTAGDASSCCDAAACAAH
jgi:hypothetical protein